MIKCREADVIRLLENSGASIGQDIVDSVVKHYSYQRLKEVLEADGHIADLDRWEKLVSFIGDSFDGDSPIYTDWETYVRVQGALEDYFEEDLLDIPTSKRVELIGAVQLLLK